MGCWVEGGTILDDELNRETTDCLRQTNVGNVDVKGISGDVTKGNEYCIGTRKKGNCCYIAAKKENKLNNNLSELSPVVLWKASLDPVSDKVGYLTEELGKPSVGGMS